MFIAACSRRWSSISVPVVGASAWVVCRRYVDQGPGAFRAVAVRHPAPVASQGADQDQTAPALDAARRSMPQDRRGGRAVVDLDEEERCAIRGGEADLGTWGVPDGVGDECGSNELGIVDDQGIEIPSLRDPSDQPPDLGHGSIGLCEVHLHIRVAEFLVVRARCRYVAVAPEGAAGCLQSAKPLRPQTGRRLLLDGGCADPVAMMFHRHSPLLAP